MLKKLRFCYEYPRPALTADCIILYKTDKDTKVLLIERKHDPFLGYWAFPGGFVDMNETTLEAAIRELKEETGLSIKNLTQLHTFSDVDRDPRGRTVSVVYYAVIDKQSNAIPGDDAKNAKWFSLSDVPKLAFDHDMILNVAKNKLLV